MSIGCFVAVGPGRGLVINQHFACGVTRRTARERGDETADPVASIGL